MATEKKPAHTPGPWNAKRFVSDAYAKSAPYSYHIASGETNVGTCDVREADARLIAAAPDLLFVAKLDQGIEDQEAWAHEWCEERALDHETPRSVLTRVRRAAIAKAEVK